MTKAKKMKPGKLKGPSHKNGGILLEAEGGEYIIKKSSVKKLGKSTLDKINKEGKLPMKKPAKKMHGGMMKKGMKKYYGGGMAGKKNRRMMMEKGGMAKKGMQKRNSRLSADPIPEPEYRGQSFERNVQEWKKGGKVGDSIKTYASGGYVEGK
tara:strand:+ start:55 stop:513 length:459 start_codon:yes stop_codon:yes gene_type:complete